LAFLPLLQGLKIEVVGIRERYITKYRTGKAVTNFRSLVRLWEEENFTLGIRPVILTLSPICINYTSTRQWSDCYLTLHNKRQATGVNDANYSTSEISKGVESRLLDFWNEKIGIQWLYHSQDVVSNNVGVEILVFMPLFSRPCFLHRKPKLSRSKCLYYSNSCAARQVLLQGGDIAVNPGPPTRKPVAPRCPQCEKPVAKNHKRCICSTCFDVTHAKCSKVFDSKYISKYISSSIPKEWVCPKCTISVLPFHKHNLSLSDTSCMSEPGAEDPDFADEHLHVLQERSHQLRLVHINTQSMVSSFDELLATIKEYPFDIVTMSETWLKDNPHLLQYVTIPGYNHVFRNRNKIRGGGVGAYLREGISYKRRIDIENIAPDIEHLWLEIPGRNKHSKMLLGVLYRSELIQDYQTWLDTVERLFGQLNVLWDGLIVAVGDVNVNMLTPNSPEVKKYTDMLTSLNLHQHVERPTRTTPTSKTLIDHIISNAPNRVTYCNVLPCPTISDHDGPYACINVRVKRFQPRYKLLRNEKRFDESAFKKELSSVPFNVVYSIDDPNEKVDIFNSLFKSCLDKHAPLRRTRITRPPAPWLNKEDIRKLQNERNVLRHLAHKINSASVWNKFREVRNKIKTKIKSVKRTFLRRALSSNKPKELWNTIHRILHPSPQPIKADPDALNKHFSSTSQRLLGSEANSLDFFLDLINSLPEERLTCPFNLRPVTYSEVMKLLTTMRSDCSTGADQIPAKYLKLSADTIASPLTHILNSFISINSFPEAWKVARVSPIPKVESPVECDHYRPIAILPAISKVYEKLVLSQLLEYIDQKQVLQVTTSGYRKGHSTASVLLRIRDDIIRAMKNGELTLIAFADFSKAFDTVDYCIVIRKLHAIGLSKAALLWFLSYLTNRQQFVQVNDKQSSLANVQFGVPQGSILGPVLFNLYANDMQDCLQDGCSCFQYADDTTVLHHATPKNFDVCVDKMKKTLSSIESWAADSNLLLNETKTKQMIITTKQMSKVHNLDGYTPPLTLKDKTVDRVEKFKLLGTWLSEDLKWTEHVNEVTSSCYKVLATLRKIKNVTPQETKKSLVQSLVLSKLNFNDSVTYPLPTLLQKRVQRVQNAAAGFVLNRFCSERDVVALGWLPTLENTQLNILKLGHRALFSEAWPEYLQLPRHNPQRTLRSSNAPLIEIPLVRGTFQDTIATLFNALPARVRRCPDFNTFKNNCLTILKSRANTRLSLDKIS